MGRRLVETELHWADAQRIVSRQTGPIAALRLLLSDPAELDALVAIEALTNPFARDAAGILATMPASRRYAGALAEVVMTPFVVPSASRFSDGSFGILYAGDSVETAKRESGHHQALRLSAARAPEGTVVPMFAFSLNVKALIVDVRLSAGADPAIYDEKVYTASQSFGRATRAGEYSGLQYDSVRCKSRECVALFFPNTVKDARAGSRWLYHFNGSEISDYVEVT